MAELDKLRLNQLHLEQTIMDIKMQGLELKGEVDRRCGKIMESVRRRVGFVPSAVQREVLESWNRLIF